VHITEECLGCGLCENSCNLDAISLIDNKAVINHELCVNCGMCAEICPVGAIEYDSPRSDNSDFSGTYPTEKRKKRSRPLGAGVQSGRGLGLNKGKAGRRGCRNKSNLRSGFHHHTHRDNHTRENLSDYKNYLKDALRWVKQTIAKS